MSLSQALNQFAQNLGRYLGKPAKAQIRSEFHMNTVFWIDFGTGNVHW